MRFRNASMEEDVPEPAPGWDEYGKPLAEEVKVRQHAVQHGRPWQSSTLSLVYFGATSSGHSWCLLCSNLRWDPSIFGLYGLFAGALKPWPGWHGPRQ